MVSTVVLQLFFLRKSTSEYFIFRDVELHGPLDDSSAFRFENFLGYLKDKVRRTGRLPLKQLICRLGEADEPIPVHVQKECKPSVKEPNNVYLLENGTAVEVISETVEDGKPLFVCRKYHSKLSLFDSPLDSRLLSCFVINDDTSIVKLECSKLQRKAFKIVLNRKTVVMALLHSVTEHNL